ncbi:MAG: YceI family protein [Candidatus Berkiellales bacterium]
MKIIKLLMVSGLFTFTFPALATEHYTLDPNHSYVQWHINHLGFSNPSGKWMAEGTLDFDQNNIPNSKVTVTIPVANIITGIDELDKHLKGKLFFEVAKFPTATFVSDKIDSTGKNTFTMQGTLSVKGISKPVTLAVTLNKIGKNPISNKESVGFSATTKLKRSDFGITTLVPDISDEVDLNIEVEAFKGKK